MQNSLLGAMPLLWWFRIVSFSKSMQTALLAALPLPMVVSYCFLFKTGANRSPGRTAAFLVVSDPALNQIDAKLVLYLLC